jgi:L-ascorbate metabolism protein UlaG (beta-lactamase superfamily)
MKLQHVRHATSIVTYAGRKILIDPVFAEKEAFPAIPKTPNQRRNPMVDLLTPMEELLNIDMILATHLHNDHFDEKAKSLLDKYLTVICQPADTTSLKKSGFHNIIPAKGTIHCTDITLTRTDAQHGTGIVGKAMAPASGYLLSAALEPTVYITGDTIFTKAVKANILKYKPDVLIMNAGSPKFLNSDRIVMNIMDIEETLKVNPKLVFVIVHLDTFNHCIETRNDIHEYFSPDKLKELSVLHFYVPKDNELLTNDCFNII